MIKEKNILSDFRIAAKKNKEDTEQVFWENEIRSNLLVGKFMVGCAVALAICWLLNALGVLAIGRQYILLIFPAGIALLLAAAAVCLALHGNRKWIKHLTMLTLIMTLAYLDGILTFNVPLLIVLPISFSCWYYSRRFTTEVFLLSTVFFAASAFIGAYFNQETPDLNFATGELSSYLRAVMLQSFLPRWIIFAVISAVCLTIAYLGRNLVLKQDIVSKEQARVETELDMASRIQANALPSAEAFPSCACRQFDLGASMSPAREVGGDFYDFFYLDETHLALIIADVADKGIAASLFMMMSKLMLDNKLTVCREPGQVLEDVNRQLNEKSFKGMFVTVWLGVLDLQTGDLVTANAGHEYPILKQGGGDFKRIRDRHGFVLGGVDSMKYPETCLHLEEGDILFVYTDGAVEANDPENSQFGEARLIESLNRNAGNSMVELITAVREDIDNFTKGTAQFDDITMLALRLGASAVPCGITVAPELSELEKVQDFVDGMAAKAVFPTLKARKVSICVDEIFSNIAKYSKATAVHVSCIPEEGKLILSFRDDGEPFDPLSEKEPDPALPVSRRVQNGLGIFITRKYSNAAEYRRLDGTNLLTLTFENSPEEKNDEN